LWNRRRSRPGLLLRNCGALVVVSYLTPPTRRSQSVTGIEGRLMRLLPLLPSGPGGVSNSGRPLPATGSGRLRSEPIRRTVTVVLQAECWLVPDESPQRQGHDHRIGQSLSFAGRIHSSRLSLRRVKRRSNPRTWRAGDCFATLAMTCRCPRMTD